MYVYNSLYVTFVYFLILLFTFIAGAPVPPQYLTMMGEYGYAHSTSSLYGGQRPTFGEDGTGMPYNSLLNMYDWVEYIYV